MGQTLHSEIMANLGGAYHPLGVEAHVGPVSLRCDATALARGHLTPLNEIVQPLVRIDDSDPNCPRAVFTDTCSQVSHVRTFPGETNGF